MKSFDDSRARSMPGVRKIVQVPSGIAVIADTFWQAKVARDALRIDWDEGAMQSFSTTEMMQQFRERAKSPGVSVRKEGDASTALAGAAKKIAAVYEVPYLSHLMMEPLNCVVDLRQDSCEVWTGSQFQTIDRANAAKTASLPNEKVQLHSTFLGGGFGRRATPQSDFVVEAVHVAKALGPPAKVKVVWTREDDMRGGWYRPAFLHAIEGGIDASGNPVSWTSRSVGQSIMTGTPFEAMMQGKAYDPASVEGIGDLAYAIPNLAIESHQINVNVPVQWLRSVGHSHTAFAVECFIDEVLEATGQDPVAGRLALMSKAPRAAGVLRAVADLARWSGPGPVNGRARGVAVVESFDSFIAQIAEVSAESGGEPKVHKVWCAVDCGVPVNPDIIRAQMEGGIGFGLGHILYAEQTLDEGRPVAGNFDTYRSLRINEMPEVDVTIVASTEKPSGVGEPGVPPIGPAVANAMAKLGVGRPRQLPVLRGGSV